MSVNQEKWIVWFEELKKNNIELFDFMKKLNKETLLSPSPSLWLESLSFKEIEDIKVFLVGNSCHPEAYASDGYAFSSIDDPDLQTSKLYKKIYLDTGITYDREDNQKYKWLKQGILCYPFQLTTISGDKKCSKMIKYWINFSEQIIEYFINTKNPKSFIFLDRYTIGMKNLKYLIKNNPQHIYFNYNILEDKAYNKNIFKTTNDFIKEKYNITLDWR